MMKRKHNAVIPAALAVASLLVILSGCGKSAVAPNVSEPAADHESVSASEPTMKTEASEAETEPGRQNGERFDDIIVLEGMEEPVHYEYLRNDTLGFEMDYDYENFVRYSEPDREWFVSCWDDPEHPENYLEVRYSPLGAEAAAAAISETLSKDYELGRDDSFPLDRAGSCIRILAEEDKGGGTMPENLQTVYVIPADDGCRVATAHCATVESEGFLRRFRYMMNTFSAVSDSGSLSIPGTWQTASMGYADDGTMQPEYFVRFTKSEILYGHLKDGQFVLDYSDNICSLEETANGGTRVQAEAANGVQYTFQTSESDNAVLEYYETWQEEDFAEMYRGGASLSRCS
jgi:hypothetical protein